MTKEEQVFLKHMMDLANIAYEKYMPVSSDFLTLYEQDLFLNQKGKLPPVDIVLNGGTSFNERRMVFFLPDRDVFSDYFPITVLKLSFVNPRFAEPLSHRDYLGALLNLGIERGVLGDIFIDEKREAYVFCKDTISEYLIQNIRFIKHTNVHVKYYEGELDILSPHFEEIRGSVMTPRLDSVIALAFHGSRSSLSGLIKSGKVFVNSRIIESSSYILKEGDIVSVRGYGKFIYQKVEGTTKKGRCYVILQKYG